MSFSLHLSTHLSIRISNTTIFAFIPSLSLAEQTNIELTDSLPRFRHLLIVPPGTQLLSEALIASPILAGDRSASIPQELLPGGAETGGGGASTTNFEFGVDPNLDPELALVRDVQSAINTVFKNTP